MQSVGGERAGWAAQESETRTCPKSSVPGAVGSDSRPATVSPEPYQAKGRRDLRRGCLGSPPAQPVCKSGCLLFCTALAPLEHLAANNISQTDLKFTPMKAA